MSTVLLCCIFHRFVITLTGDGNDNDVVDAQTPKIKAFRTQFRGVTDIKFFMYRLSKLYS